jgi:hypothetical protein
MRFVLAPLPTAPNRKNESAGSCESLQGIRLQDCSASRAGCASAGRCDAQGSPRRHGTGEQGPSAHLLMNRAQAWND